MDPIKVVAQHCGLDVVSVLGNFALYRSQSGIYANPTLKSAALSMDYTPVQWWQAFCPQQTLAPIAVKLLQLAPSSCLCERAWSDFEHPHSKRRNRLKNKRVVKLVAVKRHLRSSDPQLVDKNKRRSQDGDCTYYYNSPVVILDLDLDVPSLDLGGNADSESSDIDSDNCDYDEDESEGFSETSDSE